MPAHPAKMTAVVAERMYAIVFLFM
jgi:hypothetical protein